MSVIIFILKLLGMLLLAVIGILLLVLVLLLFYPIGYRIEGVSEEKIKFGGSLFWLFHMVSFRLDYDENGIVTCFKICGFRIGKKEKADEEQKEEFEDILEEAVPALTAMSIETEEAEEAVPAPAFSAVSNETEDADTSVEEPEAVSSQERKSKKKKAKKKRRWNLLQRWEELRKKWRDFWQNLRRAVQNITQKAADIKGQLTDPINQKAASYIWKELVYLLKHLHFRRLKAEVDFSLKDPAATGQVLGVMSMFPVIYRYDVHIYPDFLSEQVYVKGYFEGKGHFGLWHLLVSLVRLIVKKECRILLKRIFK